MAALSDVRQMELDDAASDARRSTTTISLGELFRQHHQFVARSLRRLGVPFGDVEDAVQEVFVVASRKLGAISEGAERSFLYSTAMRIASNARRVDRRAQARRSDAPADGDEAEVDAGPSAEELVDRRYARAALDAVLERMTVEIRAVFTLYELEEMTLAEIAALLGLPPGTVSSRLRRGREHFDEYVRELQTELGEREREP